MTAASHWGVGSTDGLGCERPGQQLLATRPSQEAGGLESFTYRACLSLGGSCSLPRTGTVAPPVEAGVYGHRETQRHTEVGAHTHADRHTKIYTDTQRHMYTHRHTQTHNYRPIHRITCTHVQRPRYTPSLLGKKKRKPHASAPKDFFFLKICF